MIKVDQLKKTYDRRTHHANRVLHGLSFTLPDTGFVCILGASGCGKTSLLNAIGGLDVYDSGTITIGGSKITHALSPVMERERNASFGYIFQNYYLLSEHSVAYNVYLGMHSLPLSKKEKMARVKNALKRVDMLQYRKRLVGELSGGQQQRVAIARAIARRPKVIFADEPTGNLDEVNTLNICSILKELSKESLVVMVTHEERIARFFADRIITLQDGNILSDSTDWAREQIDAGEKNTLYAGDYNEDRLSTQEISLRLLTAENAAPVALTVVAEADRIVIKVSDNRTVICSEDAVAPYLAEGKRPILDVQYFANNTKSTVACEDDGRKKKKRTRGGLGFGLLMREASSLVSGKKMRQFGTSVFIILLSLMLAMSVSDIITVAHINPEDFISVDSHTINLKFERGPKLVADKQVWSLGEYIDEYVTFLDSSKLDFDYLPATAERLVYRDSSVPQLGSLSMMFSEYSLVNLNRFDEETLIYGRMPERSDEIIIDRWVIDKQLASDGILQNIIPNAEFLLGKKLYGNKNDFSLTVVGICDSGEPSVYMSTEGILSIGVCGTELMTLSEFRELTGYDDLDTLAVDECIILADNAGYSYLSKIGGTLLTAGEDILNIKDVVEGYSQTFDITAELIIADEALEPMYRSMITAANSFTVWCVDKPAMHMWFDTQLPESLNGMLDIGINDSYERAYSQYLQQVMVKLDARTIITVAVMILSIVMLYLMQRSKIRERMDLIAVYRLLGIPKRNLLTIFAAECLILTGKYATPTVLLCWLAMRIVSSIEAVGLTMLYPVWAAVATLLAILLVRLLVAVLPVSRLLVQPPAKLAAKYDF